MARADLLKKLFSSFNNDDRELFIKTAHEIIADERKKNHSILADDLEMVLNGAKKHYRHSMPAMKTVVAQNTDKEARLVEIVYPDKYFDDVILPREKVLQLEEVIREFQNWDILISNGAVSYTHLHKAADLMVRQFQDTMQDQNALLLGGQTGKGIRHKLVVDMQVIPM